ncbi:MAG: hypothetical protein DHS20C21_07910 [Gemmatimonadota bacterium]|nr:MAG: hypothetical protein DHS20C21_07910 [Gemmatimonadota bacterium]
MWTARRAHRLSLALLTALAGAAFTAPAGASWVDLHRSLVFFDDSAPGTAREFLEELQAAGGHASVIYPGTAAIVYAGEAELAPVSRWIRERHERSIDLERFASRSEDAARIAAVWNHSLEQRAAAPRELALDAPAGTGRPGEPRRVPVTLPDVPARRDAPDHIPLGAEYYDCGTYLAGTTAVGVWLLESTGSAYDWSTAEETETLTGVQDGLDAWVVFGDTHASLSFFVDIHTGVPVSDDPITFPQGTESTWIGEALTGAGWTGANTFEKCFAYNNDLRDTFETNWCFSYFIVDSDPAVNQGLFSTGGYAWAYFGGPWVYMSRYSTWAFNAANYFQAVPMHELGHIYYATDEYDGGAQQRSGYLGLLDSGNGGVVCLMNQNVHTIYCNGTKRQIAWRDTDMNGVIEPLDPAPLAPLDELLPDPTPDALLTWTGTATVTTLPNLNPNAPYSPAHDITINTIDAVECRVDGGAWSAATPVDGTFDAYVEDFTWDSPALTPGLHTVEARSQTSQGIWSDVFGTDTIEVQSTTGVSELAGPADLRLEPSRPNPARTTTDVHYAIPADGPVRVAIYSVEGARVRGLYSGDVEAGRHAISWNGRNDAGDPVPAGVYLIRLDTEQGTRTTKLVWER